MNYKSKILLFISALLMVANPAYGGKQGISFYYGIGAGAVQLQEKSASLLPKHDAAGGGEVFIGFEEDGWAIEYGGFQSVESGTDNDLVDYKINGTKLSLNYRSIEKGNSYFKFGFGRVESDYDFIDKTLATTVTTSFEDDGSMYSLGMGFRVKRDARLELDYTYYSPSGSDFSSVHMLSLRYIFGGTPYEGNTHFD